MNSEYVKNITNLQQKLDALTKWASFILKSIEPFGFYWKYVAITANMAHYYVLATSSYIVRTSLISPFQPSLNDSKVAVIFAKMPQEMQKDAIDFAIKALDMPTAQGAKNIAKYMIKEFKLKYKGTWYVLKISILSYSIL